MSNNEDNIKVSVCVVTYNQENYIAQCLQSIVDQKTDFKFEVIVGEDCSTDGTRAIVQQYVEKYPNLIKPIFYKKNVGAGENVRQVYIEAKGKYIAHVDGDDIALPSKLQKQFDILESNLDCSICVHNMRAIDSESKTMKESFELFEERKYTLLDLYLINPFFIHSSKMFINKTEDYIDSINMNTLDTEIHIEQAKQGDIYLLSEELGCYRQFVGITYQNEFVSSLIRERIQHVYDNIDKSKFTEEQLDEIKSKYARILLEYAYQCSVSINDEKLFKEYVYKSLDIKKIGIVSQVFKISLLSPTLFSKMSKLRSYLKNRSVIN